MVYNYINPNKRIIIDEQGNLVRIRSSGVICKRVYNDKLYFLFVKQIGGKWSFPKGAKEENETEYECALREFNEEVGININNLKNLKSITIYSNTYLILNTTSNQFLNDELKEELHDISINSICSKINYNAPTNNIYNSLLLNEFDDSNEIVDISWIDVDTIRKYITEFNADVRVLVNSKRQHWFHIKVFGKKFINTIFNNSHLSTNLTDKKVEFENEFKNEFENEIIDVDVDELNTSFEQFRCSPIQFLL
jgi:8-oxo-dGTP pyrophosphatase MutT (NUDIX family)